MFHEPVNEFLYSAYRINTEFTDQSKKLNFIATGFILEIAPGVAWIITNRHVVDIDYKKTTTKQKDFKLSSFIITGRKEDDTEYSFKLHEDAEFYFHEEYENDVVLIRARVYLVENQIWSCCYCSSEG